MLRRVEASPAVLAGAIPSLPREAERRVVDQRQRGGERRADLRLDLELGGIAALDPDAGDHDAAMVERDLADPPAARPSKSIRRPVKVALPATPVSGGMVSK